MRDWSLPPEKKARNWSLPPEASNSAAPMAEKEQSLKEKALRYGVKNPAAGVAKFGRQIVNIPSNLAQFMGDKTSADILSVGKDFDIDKALGLPAEKNWADMLIQMAPEIAGAAFVPAANLGKAGAAIGKIPHAGKYMQKILSEALPQAGYAGVMASPEHALESAGIAGATQAPFSAAAQLAMSSKPGLQKALSYGVGLGAGAATNYGLNQIGVPGLVSYPAAVAASIIGKKGVGTRSMMMDELTKGINPQMAAERLAAAERLGLDYLTPAEAGRNPYLGKKQGELGRTPEGSQLLYEKANKRVASEEKAINELLESIYNEKALGPKIESGYASLSGSKLPENFYDKFKNNAIIKSAEKSFSTEPAYIQAGSKLPHTENVIDKNNIAYWDNIKKILDDKINSASTERNATKAHNLRETRRELIDSLDEISPEYKEMRYLSEREMTRNNLEKAFDRTNVNSGASFFKALASKKKFDEIQHHLRNIPEAQAKLKDMRELFRDFSAIPTVKTSKGLSSTGMMQHRNTMDALKEGMEHLFQGGKLDKEGVEFITSKDWHKQIQDLNKISDKQKRYKKTIEVFGKIAAQANAKANENKEPYLETQNYEFYD